MRTWYYTARWKRHHWAFTFWLGLPPLSCTAPKLCVFYRSKNWQCGKANLDIYRCFACVCEKERCKSVALKWSDFSSFTNYTAFSRPSHIMIKMCGSHNLQYTFVKMSVKEPYKSLVDHHFIRINDKKRIYIYKFACDIKLLCSRHGVKYMSTCS